MHTLVFLMLVTYSSCLAHYRGSYESRNYITREEPKGVLIECPVCPSEGWDAIEEVCIKEGDKSYKLCRFGTYINTACNNRLDCLRGPREKCTEKHVFNRSNKKCTFGYECNQKEGVCTGPENRPEIYWPYRFGLYPDRRSSSKGTAEEAFEDMTN
ncbi:uncharacterized protein LOC110380436 [Helicoverpa armigera]|uniref:uncharacterized protein LOC110380436 n=1 Tax=Helicoverpa armigera TaxID=29058 RepID=UPI001F59147D|nr:uncharacterized protein LOC110380436 [Helicoverpa armigera]XP_047034215.1 uncharacterized protein LOC124640475 [Helicoverpa zea]